MSNSHPNHPGLNPEPFWYKSGVIYELHVRAFADSDDDGIGDFRGLTSKLGYLKDLGITALWLLPFYPSPLKDDGYDTADYFEVHPDYGTLADFKTFLREAHRLGLRVITELVLNHTSDQHPWFQRARRAEPGSRWRDFYVWSETSEKYQDARIIFKDIEVSNWTWDPVGGAYFWHRFFSHQPDLNWENPEVYDEMVKVLDFWFDLGVDGLRLDAVPYLYEREGTSCENLPETHATLKRLRKHVDEKYGDRMLLGEANQWPEDAVAYFGEGKGDECHMAFHFPLMPRLFMALRMEDRTPIVDILEQTPAIPETSQWALFLRNHDELTLEMVTDEERDYMYRAYAQVNRARLNLGIRRRLAPLLGNDRRRIELLNAVLLSLPGTPVLYYGDEIGMGENIYLGDRNGVRTPMQWSSEKNAGFSRANPQSLYLPLIYDLEYHYESVNVETQLHNTHSLLWWMRRLLALRKRWRAFGEGKCEFLQPENHRILSYLLRFEKETILVVANLSRFVQPIELDLEPFIGHVPVELFGRMEFPAITDKPYFLTLSPHALFWFSLEDRSTEAVAAVLPGVVGEPRVIKVTDDWTSVLEDKGRSQLEALLPGWLAHQRWFAGKLRTVKHASLRTVIPVPCETASAFIALVQVEYVQGEADLYTVPLAFASGREATALRDRNAGAVICEISLPSGSGRGVLYDAAGNKEFCSALLKLIANRRRLKSAAGELEPTRTAVFRQVSGRAGLPEPHPCKAEGRNSSVVFGDKFILKLFRHLYPGQNPDQEVGELLTLREFPHSQRVAGSLGFTDAAGEYFNLGILNEFIPNSRNAWEFTLETLGCYYENAAAAVADGRVAPVLEMMVSGLTRRKLPAVVEEAVGPYLDAASVLGERTAELHLALAAATDLPRFAPEPFTPHYVRGLFQSMRNRASQNLRLLGKRLATLPPGIAALAQQVIDLEPEIMKCYRASGERPITARRIRCHGDFHLDQLLYTGKDFVVIDFEGEPGVALSQRTIKRCALRDVAGMIRSFHYAAWTGLHEHVQRGSLEVDCLHQFEPWARLWYRSVSVTYLQAYLDGMAGSEVVPQAEDELTAILPAFLIDRAIQEIGLELDHRPDWLHVPLQGILGVLEITRPPFQG
ncbi:MAG: maltose alpha-D-glucosyltransferase [Akkermansiaceae bacterium]|nr:maltose alpha-D-glucosyltransferase [Akkermansiaceae bacterium]MCF7733601.1 maltose alpha-D-glucosyltransferase [Akkermansiaceae bacterium]